MRYLGIDYGHAHTGIAIGDDESRLALPDQTIHEKNTENLLQFIVRLIKEESIDAIVIGNPLTMQGDEEGQSKSTKKFIEQLQDSITIPIYKQDERMSSKMAQKQKIEAPHSKYDVHALAAASILQTYLDKVS